MDVGVTEKAAKMGGESVAGGVGHEDLEGLTKTVAPCRMLLC